MEPLEFDARTLAVIAVVSSLSLLGATIFARRIDPSQRGGLWTVAAALLTVGLLLNSFAGGLPNLLTDVVGSGLTVASFCLIYQASRTLLRAPPRWPWWWLLALLEVGALWFTTMIVEDVSWRLFSLSLTYSGLLLATAWTFWRHGEPELHAVRMTTCAVMLVGCAQFALSSLAAVAFGHPSTAELLPTWVIGLPFVYSIVLAVWLAVMLTVTMGTRVQTELARERDHTQVISEELAAANRELEVLAVTDPLTGLNNRARLDESLAAEVDRSLRYGDELSVALIDIDHFKAVNDTYGHLVGDAVLVTLAGILVRSVRVTDTVGRWGGEEFLIVLPNTGAQAGRFVAEDLRAAVESEQFDHRAPVTISAGVATFIVGESADDLVARADEALYLAKDAGRNLVVLVGQP